MKTHRITIQTAADTDVLPQDVPVLRLHSGPGLISDPDTASDNRTYLRRQRAAEMAVWEQSGGDYLRSDYLARCGDQIELSD